MRTHTKTTKAKAKTKSAYDIVGTTMVGDKQKKVKPIPTNGEVAMRLSPASQCQDSAAQSSEIVLKVTTVKTP